MTPPKQYKTKIILFSCINTQLNDDVLSENKCELQYIKLACSSMIKDVFLLRAFESGADAVVVMVCPEGECRHTEGNIRAEKRIRWVKNLLDEIGLNRKRLSIHHIASGDNSSADKIIRDTLSGLDELGSNPCVSNPCKAVA